MENVSQLREKRNLILFVISYIINNLASGILYDTYINYLQEVYPAIATSFWAFYGYATFISAAILLIAPKSGYKKLLLLCTLCTSSALLSVVFVKSPYILYLGTLLALTGVQLHYIILAPYVAAYTEKLAGEQIDWYTRTYYLGYVGYLLATYLGGAVVVKVFSLLSQLSYPKAQAATRFVARMSGTLHSSYLRANQITLVIVGVFNLLALIPICLIDEKKTDYQSTGEERTISVNDKIKKYFSVFLNKNAMAYLLYWVLVSFAMGLFTSYYTVFLNQVLHIDKVMSSLLVSISYLAIIVFMFFTPKMVRKFGEVGTIFITMMLSIPFMILIANGDHFGKYTVPVVGVALFIRAGLANLSSPADSSLSMRIVAKELRPVYTSVVNFVAGIASILSGSFTGKILFKTLNGYRQAYYIAAVLYVLAGLVLLLGLRKFRSLAKNEVKKE